MRSLEIKKIALDFNNLKNSMENNNYCYIHVCNINNGLVILKELLDRIIKVSLDKKLEEIRVCILGPSNHSQISNIESYNPKIKVIYTNDNIKLYEYPTLKLIYNFCQDKPDCNILYIHTKGASKPRLKAEASWRQYMSYFVIDKYSNCLNILNKGYDSTGCEMKKSGGKFKYLHYAGNFWWAKSDYIGRDLPDPQNFVSQDIYYRESKIYRFHAEEWIMMDNNVKPFCLFTTNRNLIKYPIKFQEYQDGDQPYLNYLHILRSSNIITQATYETLILRNKKRSLLMPKNKNIDTNVEKSL